MERLNSPVAVVGSWPSRVCSVMRTSLSAAGRSPTRRRGRIADRPRRGGSVPVVGAGVRPRAARRAVAAVDVDQSGVDLTVAVRRLADPGPGPRRVEELRDAVGAARPVLRVGVPAALLAPQVLEAGE